jgi:hypothetical protein
MEYKMKSVASPSLKKNKLRPRLSSVRKPVIAPKNRQSFSLTGLEQLASKVDFICRNVKYPQAFAKDLVKSIRLIAGNGGIQPLVDCIESWGATAELDAVPQMRKRILKAYSDLTSGKTKTTSSRKKFLELVNAE